ncbi:MAG: hypothetical protein LBG58_14095 [Planctomycetaceae bacterium]|nr:hypothetical protein [Planctomycetaceae bacterium]
MRTSQKLSSLVPKPQARLYSLPIRCQTPKEQLGNFSEGMIAVRTAIS